MLADWSKFRGFQTVAFSVVTVDGRRCDGVVTHVDELLEAIRNGAAGGVFQTALVSSVYTHSYN